MPRRAPAALALLAALAACSSGDAAPRTATPPAGTPPAQGLVPTYDGRLRAPAGVQVTLWGRVPAARALAVGPDGAVYVSQPSQDRIHRLTDADGDGTAEVETLTLAGLDRPHGMLFHGGAFYVANTGALVRFAVRGGRPAGAPETVVTYASGGGHWTRTVIAGADGALYVSIGSTCNICEEQSPERAAVLRVDPAARTKRVFAQGLRNAVGMAVHAPSGAIWVSQHERDNLRPDHQDLPPEEINILRDGAHYGWPWCHSARVPNPEYGDAARCATTEPPALALQAHSAPLGMAFLTGATRLPDDARGDLLLAFHGSWNRDVPTGAKVVRIRVRDGRPASYEDFITGWQRADGSRWGRPVDVLVAADGAVLVSDDQGGVVWRVSR
jgi:glucose/arabinose dehydrogenase